MDFEGRQFCPQCMRILAPDGNCPVCRTFPVALPDQLESGTLLRGKYLIAGLIARGKTSLTYSGWDEGNAQSIAIREFFPRGLASRDVQLSDTLTVKDEDAPVFAKAYTAFAAWQSHLCRMQHLPILDCFPENATHYIVIPFLRSPAFAAWKAENDRQESSSMV
ncbi:MAG: hypothetical protein IJ246_08135 [Clostridia bacterium]|nr:hypothetical protein [Clostridia bacterium]